MVGVAVRTGEDTGRVEPVDPHVTLDRVRVAFRLVGNHVVGQLHVAGGGDQRFPGPVRRER